MNDMFKDNAASVAKYWNNPDTVSLKDENLRRLELRAISKWLEKDSTVLDLGCGDGVNTVVYAGSLKHVTGIDYSEEMIARAKRRTADGGPNNVDFQHMSVLELNRITDQYDAVISQRCLINLSSFQEQKEAIKQVRSLIKPAGLYLMLEAVEQGRETLNSLRAEVGLDPISMPWHNVFFNESELHPVLDELFEVVKIEDFSLYYLITRSLNEILEIGLNDPMSARLDKAAETLQSDLSLENLSGIGPQRLYVLQNKQS